MKRLLGNWLALFGLAFLLLSCSQAPQEQLVLFQGRTMGTTWSVKMVVDEETLKGHSLYQDISAALEDVNHKMSTYRADSEVSRFNDYLQTTAFEVSEETAKVVAESLRVGRLSDGALDITVGPLVDLWGFGPDARPEVVPSDEVIAEVKQRTGLDKLKVVGNKLFKAVPELHIDLSATAKGYGVDKVAELLDKRQIHNYLVEVGGELRARGTKPNGQPWRIAIEKPQPGERSVQLVIMPGDMAVATSGDYRNYFEYDGQRYSHTIDPATGKPIQHNLASVTVLHPSCLTADALATALNVMGPEKGMALAEKLNLPVYMIVKGADGFSTLTSTAFYQMLNKVPR